MSSKLTIIYFDTVFSDSAGYIYSLDGDDFLKLKDIITNIRTGLTLCISFTSTVFSGTRTVYVNNYTIDYSHNFLTISFDIYNNHAYSLDLRYTSSFPTARLYKVR